MYSHISIKFHPNKFIFLGYFIFSSPKVLLFLKENRKEEEGKESIRTQT